MDPILFTICFALFCSGLIVLASAILQGYREKKRPQKRIDDLK
jgi:hypothetical protein